MAAVEVMLLLLLVVVLVASGGGGEGGGECCMQSELRKSLEYRKAGLRTAPVLRTNLFKPKP